MADQLNAQQAGANAYQVGGTHYKVEYEHWDLALTVPLSYLEGCATKYICRWRKKGTPVDDLKKGLHYLNKLEEVGPYASWLRILTHAEVSEEVRRFAEANGLSDMERRFTEILATWKSKDELEEARALIFQMLDAAATPVPLTEENKHGDRVGGTLEY